MDACELLAVEHRLDAIEAELAGSLPSHMRRFAQAYAAGQPWPAAPDVVLRASTLAAAHAALAHPVVADRGLAVLRLAAPIAIEADAGVAAARAARVSWDALAALAAARRDAARARWGRPALDVLHALHGTSEAAGGIALPPLPPPVAGWFAPDGDALEDRAIERAWQALAARHGVAGVVRFARALGPPRTFVVQPGREAVVVVPAQVASPAARFAVLHELGHAVAALAVPAGLPRVLDEAAASYTARAIEQPGDDWYSAAAGPARQRRLLLARILDRIERQIDCGAPAIAERPAELPPWALWHDPGAQAAYVAAEPLADALEAAVGPAPVPGALARVLGDHRARIDRAGAAILA
jgi:hypothetical protein